MPSQAYKGGVTDVLDIDFLFGYPYGSVLYPV